MKSAVLRVIFVSLAVASAIAATSAAAPGERPRVRAIELANDINPVTADYVTQELELAADDGYDAAVILLDTPGGLADAMRDIVQAELASKIPVVVYVSPDGAQAASAGVWIGQAADVLAMAPQTNIGSSTPVSVGGEDIQEDLRRKAVNDAAASLRALAREHGRNARWADAAVRRASNLNAREALERDVIDVVAPSLPALLDRIDGRKTVPKGFVLDTADARIDRVEMSLWKRVLDTLIDPNIIVLMLSVGLIGIVVELWSPGLIFPGTVGGISLIVSLYGLQVLPVSWAGLLLIVLGLGFLAAEPFVTSHGALALAGAVCFAIGALMLFDPAGDSYQVSVWTAVAVAGTLALFMAILVVKVTQARRQPVEVDVSRLSGGIGRVRYGDLVFVNGELWKARSVDGTPLLPDEPVEVVGVEGLTLTVRPARERAEAPRA
ncbi:MAG: nodulation protein NfeD [Actinomycetota bacterium]|nr:nodulation protein NfeD [Actinomycetota bacterium]